MRIQFACGTIIVLSLLHALVFIRVAAQQAAERKREEEAALLANRQIKAAEEKQARLDAMRDETGACSDQSCHCFWLQKT